MTNDDYEPDLPFFHRHRQHQSIPLTQCNAVIRCRSDLVKLIDKYSDCLTERLFRTEAHIAWQLYNDNLERQDKAKTKTKPNTKPKTNAKSRFYQEEVASANSECSNPMRESVLK
jgi:hypothetical protein